MSFRFKKRGAQGHIKVAHRAKNMITLSMPGTVAHIVENEFRQSF
jgi:hypothetical protein